MAIVTEYSWENDTFTHHAPTPERQAFRDALQGVAEKAKAALPENAGRIDRAVQIVLQGDVQLLPDGHARVASQCQGTVVYRVVNGTCDCKDYPHAPASWCKHRLAAAIQRRAEGLVDTQAAAQSVPGAQESVPAQAPSLPESLKPYITYLHGKPFVQYAGLLALAHARGLVSLKTDFLSVTPDIALARAEALFANGQCFTECADASPSNVGSMVRAHYPRMALVRAKSRALRDALNIPLTAIEELEG